MQLKRLSLTLAALGLASAHALAYDYAPLATTEPPNSDYAPLAAADLPISTPALSASAPALAYEAKSAAAAESATVVASAAPASAETLLPAFSAADIESLFVPSDAPMQLAALSAQEMRETEGAVIWFAPVLWTGARYALTGFTRHGLNQVISRGGTGVSNQAILNTLRNPLPGSQSFISGPNANTTRFIGHNATVVMNRSGQIVSAWVRNSAGRR